MHVHFRGPLCEGSTCLSSEGCAQEVSLVSGHIVGGLRLWCACTRAGAKTVVILLELARWPFAGKMMEFRCGRVERACVGDVFVCSFLRL